MPGTEGPGLGVPTVTELAAGGADAGARTTGLSGAPANGSGQAQGGRGPVQGGNVAGPDPGELDVERDSDVPISTQIYWQLAYQIDSGRWQSGSRLPPVRELGAALRVNPNTIRAVY